MRNWVAGFLSDTTHRLAETDTNERITRRDHRADLRSTITRSGASGVVDRLRALASVDVLGDHVEHDLAARLDLV